ncbi:exonuclease domain-containing protein [Photobacterium swingsii]|uniref:Exonuclease n=1 Tax=Photobacterium swingsii TaxID=680026 RepID=A0A0J8VGU1_9GAMM|nr:3'-5' exonuclease [Photobacterium swingsii]KMV31695.1 exonuclease [Photobacterium swingsii]PSW25295.1 exonuclease [Photobacterium swingsii]
MNYNRIVCFDLEMCCWNDERKARTGEIIEIGVAELDLQSGDIVRRAQHYVLPEHDEVSYFCTELTGIKPEVIAKNGKPLATILKSIEQKFGGRHKIYAAWGHDDQILRAECEAKGLKVPFEEYLNIATLFRMQPHVKKKRCGQRTAMEIAGIEWEGRQHSGYVDAFNLARLTKTLFIPGQDTDTE